ncbi:hypothetical protein GNQ08_12900 [Paenibacillus macerans]|uniref:Uncharacterized protein n=1 Tax=Paenibacillus macerans TaxID=44252 RepID=A0A6N8EY96_PAEMA|nr:hypothetical protein [Paenibacillus macerans]MUG23301.1 hypothetical protein [Paenibacillus macerans]UMV45965.1 hypothetical protein LMZ02_21030 [Paenibacillus macerans]
MKDDQAAQWFGLCTDWLSQTFGEFASDADVILNEEIDEYSIDVQLGVLWKNQECKRTVLTVLPVLADSTQLQDAWGVPLRTIIEFGEGLLSEDAVNQLNQHLIAIPVSNKEL